MTSIQQARQVIINMAANVHGMRLFHLFVGLIDLPVTRLTKGKFIPSANFNIMPIIYLTTTGARSGIERSVPVLCVPDGEDLILVASNWGKHRNPSWAYNLRANPQVRVRRSSGIKTYTARELRGDERTVYWQKAIAFYPPYPSYERRSGRRLPIFLLKP